MRSLKTKQVIDSIVITIKLEYYLEITNKQQPSILFWNPCKLYSLYGFPIVIDNYTVVLIL